MRRRYVLIALTMVIAVCVALPAAGAPSPFSLAKSALGTSKKANKKAKKATKSAKSANRAARRARRRADQALGQIAGGVPSADFATRAGSADNVIRIPRTRVTTSASNADQATARAAATPVPLLTRGQLSLYGKCFVDETAPTVWAEVIIATSADGATVYSTITRREGTNSNGFLNTGDDEGDRRIIDASSQAGSSPSFQAAPDEVGVTAMAPDGSGFMGGVFAAARHADALPPEGAYGAGSVCLFGGYAFGL